MKLFQSPLLMLWATGLFASAMPATAAQFIVAPNGNDANDGTPAHPFASPLRARDAARLALGRGEKVEVVLRGGTYELRDALTLGAQDSGTATNPVTWRAADGAVVRLSSGRMITGWHKVIDPAIRARLDPAARDRILAIDLKAQGITDYGEMSGGFGQNGTPGLELFLDDVPAHISRYPNDRFITITDVLGATPIDVRGTKGTKEGIFKVADPHVTRWVGEKDPRVMGYWFWDWADERQKIASIDPQQLTITLAPPWHGFGYRKGQYFYAFNLLSEIDQPGEWYLDRETGILYALPFNDRVPQRTMVSLLPTALKLDGAAHINLRGLIFEGARADVVLLHNCESCALIGCTIRNSGKWAARIDGGHNCAVRGCDISGTGDGGVNLSSGDRATLTPAGHVVENCHIHHYSRWDRTYQAGISLNGVGCRAAHNLIHDAPHQAMNFGGNDHVIEFNEIHNVCEETNDAGAIYAWNDWAARGNQIRYNYIHHVYGRATKGANGVYLDDCFSSANIYGNVFESLVRPIHLGGGRDHQVVNNLFVDCYSALHIDARGLGWRAYGFDDLKKKLEQWPYKQPPWSQRYPTLVNILEDEPMAPKGIVVTRNIMVATEWNDIEAKAKPYLKMEQNILDASRDVLAAGNTPMPEVNPAAPAVKDLKFEPIPYAQIGLYRSAERASWPVLHPVTKQAWPNAKNGGSAARTEPPAQVLAVNQAPKIDGTVSPGEYPGAPLLLAETPGRDKLTTPPGKAWLAHDAQRLYIAVTIPADKPEKLVGNAAWGAADAVEVAFRRQAKTPGPTFILQGFADGHSAPSLAAGAPPALATALQQASRFAAHSGPHEWTAEWSIPLQASGIAMQPGLTLGFNLGARRLETDDWLVWTGTGHENWRLDGAGHIVLK